MKNQKNWISILPLLILLRRLELFSQHVDLLCVSWVFVGAERLQELAKTHLSIAIYGGFQLGQQHRFLCVVFGHEGTGLRRDEAGFEKNEEGAISL